MHKKTPYCNPNSALLQTTPPPLGTSGQHLPMWAPQGHPPHRPKVWSPDWHREAPGAKRSFVWGGPLGSLGRQVSESHQCMIRVAWPRVLDLFSWFELVSECVLSCFEVCGDFPQTFCEIWMMFLLLLLPLSSMLSSSGDYDVFNPCWIHKSYQYQHLS